MEETLERPQIVLRGLRSRAPVLGATLVLHGAGRAELQRACAMAALLSDRCLLVAVDGGLKTCRAARRRPDLYVGDVDSVRRAPRNVPSVLYDPAKDFNDLSGALEEARARGVRVVAVAGLLGGRLDHEWANLAELGRMARGFAGILAPTGRGSVLVSATGFRAKTVRGREVSLVALGGPARVTLRGTRWSLRRQLMRPGSLGLSNETGTSLDLVVHRGTVAVIFPA